MVPRIPRSAALPADLFPIVTPLKADRWQHWIAEAGLEEGYGDVPDGIRLGFAHGLDRSLAVRTTFIPKNLTSALEHTDIIDTYLAKEEALGRISIPLDPALLEERIGPFRCLPVGCVQKDPPTGKWRMYNHHSFPYDDPELPSVNSQIDKEEFTCEWGTFAQCFLIIAKAPAGTQVRVELAAGTLYSRDAGGGL